MKRIVSNKKERRKNERQVCWVPVDGKQGSAFASTQTVDISRNGIGFVSKKKIPLDKKIAVELDFAAPYEPALVMGQVKWVSPIPKSLYYRIGMSFTGNLSVGSKTQLKDFLAELS